MQSRHRESSPSLLSFFAGKVSDAFSSPQRQQTLLMSQYNRNFRLSNSPRKKLYTHTSVQARKPCAIIQLSPQPGRLTRRAAYLCLSEVASAKVWSAGHIAAPLVRPYRTPSTYSPVPKPSAVSFAIHLFSGHPGWDYPSSLLYEGVKFLTIV